MIYVHNIGVLQHFCHSNFFDHFVKFQDYLSHLIVRGAACQIFNSDIVIPFLLLDRCICRINVSALYTMQERYIIHVNTWHDEFLPYLILRWEWEQPCSCYSHARAAAAEAICGAVGLLGFVYTLLLLTVWLNFLSFQTKVTTRLKSLRLRLSWIWQTPHPPFHGQFQVVRVIVKAPGFSNSILSNLAILVWVLLKAKLGVTKFGLSFLTLRHQNTTKWSFRNVSRNHPL